MSADISCVHTWDFTVLKVKTVLHIFLNICDISSYERDILKFNYNNSMFISNMFKSRRAIARLFEGLTDRLENCMENQSVI